MNKKLFLAGIALLAAVGFTSCNSDTPIDSSNPSGVTPTTARHQVGGDYYDWTAIVKNLQELKDFWKDDQAAVKKLLADKEANTANILIKVAGYELKAGDVITLPDFWQTNATNGKVVNITFEGTFKNADFERAHAIDKNDTGLSKFPVTINTNTLKGAEVNFTFNVEKFDLVLATREARSTFAGDFTIGYMKADADVNAKDAVELKSGVVEGVDVNSTGNFKGSFDGVWTKDGDWFEVAANGIKTTSNSVIPGSKNVYLENTALIDTWYRSGNNDVQYKLGTVKFVQNANNPSITLILDGTKGAGNTNFVTEDAIEKVQGFNKGKCHVQTSGMDKALDNIDAMEKVTVIGWTNLKKDIFTDVEFLNNVSFSTKNITSFADVTFDSWVDITVHADNQEMTFNGVNFKGKTYLIPGITSGVVTAIHKRYYQWIIDNSDTGDGHYEEYGNATGKSLLDTNKDKEIKEYDSNDIDYNATTRTFDKVNGTDAQRNEARASYVVTIYDIYYDGVWFTPEGTKVVMDGNCKFKEPKAPFEMTTNFTALNNIWGNRTLWDEECWYSVNFGGVDYIWKKATTPGTTPTSYFVLYPAAE